VREVGGTVEWIDDPAVAGIVAADRAFFGQNLVGGEAVAEAGHDGLLSPHVDLSHEVDHALELHRLDAPVRLAEDLTTGAGGLGGYLGDPGKGEIGHDRLFRG
jgi:hypothetical protein